MAQGRNYGLLNQNENGISKQWSVKPACQPLRHEYVCAYVCVKSDKIISTESLNHFNIQI